MSLESFCTISMFGMSDKCKCRPSTWAVEAAEAEAAAFAEAPPSKVQKVIRKISGVTSKVAEIAQKLSKRCSLGSRMSSEAGSIQALSPNQDVEIIEKIPTMPKDTASPSKNTLLLKTYTQINLLLHLESLTSITQLSILKRKRKPCTIMLMSSLLMAKKSLQSSSLVSSLYILCHQNWWVYIPLARLQKK